MVSLAYLEFYESEFFLTLQIFFEKYRTLRSRNFFYVDRLAVQRLNSLQFRGLLTVSFAKKSGLEMGVFNMKG